MPSLLPSEYDISYFDGSKSSLQHNAGYTKYERWHRKLADNDTGEHWKDLASSLKNSRGLAGKKVLEIGCAKGFVVEDLRALGVDAYGVDVSSYAVSQAAASVAPFLTVADVRTSLLGYPNNSFDAVFSMRFLECLSEAELGPIIVQLNRISRFQFHIIGETPNPTYYLNHPISWWKALGWDKGTVLISTETSQEVTK